jgi:hypothetical protein
MQLAASPCSYLTAPESSILAWIGSVAAPLEETLVEVRPIVYSALE